MTDFQIAYKSTTKEVVIQIDGVVLPAGFTDIGKFSDADTEALDTDNSVVFNRVKDALYIENGVGGITDMSRVIITMWPQSITVTPTTVTIDVASTIQLSATLTPANTFGNEGVTWSIDADTYATVSANGLVTGVDAGQATVTATSNSGALTDTCVITVVAF
jgi:uncharacterized protein YjdB